MATRRCSTTVLLHCLGTTSVHHAHQAPHRQCQRPFQILSKMIYIQSVSAAPCQVSKYSLQIVPREALLAWYSGQGDLPKTKVRGWCIVKYGSCAKDSARSTSHSDFSSAPKCSCFCPCQYSYIYVRSAFLVSTLGKVIQEKFRMLFVRFLDPSKHVSPCSRCGSSGSRAIHRLNMVALI